LEEYKRETGNSGKKIKDIPTTEELPDETANLTRDEVQRLSKAISKQDYLSHLDAVSKVIADEQRGAYARWFQDPTYLAVFIPSGLSGLIPLIGWLWPDK